MKLLFQLSLLFLLCAGLLPAADVTGDWKFVTTTPNGDGIYATFKLKSDGDKVGGTIEAEFPGKVTIEEGSCEGDSLKLKVKVVNEDGNSVTYQLTGTVSGAEIKGIVEAEVDGEKIKMNWSAKKA